MDGSLATKLELQDFNSQMKSYSTVSDVKNLFQHLEAKVKEKVSPNDLELRLNEKVSQKQYLQESSEFQE